MNFKSFFIVKIFRLLFFSFLVLFLVVTAISLFIPSHIRISKAINISANTDSVFNQVNDPVKWKNWFPDLDSAKLYYDKGVVIGVIIDDSSQQYIKITGITKDEVITELRAGSRKIKSGWKIIDHSQPNSTTLQWYMDFHLRCYPWEKFASFLFEKSYGFIMEQGLNNIKKLAESDHTSSK